jgi:LysR family transcriptional activator of nhaA
MSGLNYLHLEYFWSVVRYGSVAEASRRLGVGLSTISAQIKKLERRLGGPLLVKSGRGVEPTELGRHVYSYADEIFAIGGDLQASLLSGETTRRVTFKVGLADGVPKLIAYHLLAPSLGVDGDLCLQVIEEEPSKLFAQLALHQLDLVIADQPLPSSSSIRAYSHALGESHVGLFAEPALASRLAADFPQSLDGAPLLLPDRSSSLCVDFSLWCEDRSLRPRVVGHLADSALAMTFASAGHGAVLAPLAVRSQIERSGLQFLGACEGLRVRYHAVSVERRLRHPAVLAVCRGARLMLDEDLGEQG